MTVTIGGRELEVKVATLGFLKNKLRPARRACVDADEGGQEDAIAGLVHCYVGHNDGVTVEWLLDNLPADPTEIMRACITASGQKVAPAKDAAPGEAARP